MTNNNVYLSSSSSTKSCDTSYSSSKDEMEVASVVQPYEWEPQASNEDFDEVYDSFSPAVFRSRLEQKTPIAELVCCICVLFSMAKSC